MHFAHQNGHERECDDVIVSNIGLVYILMTYKQCNDYYAFLFVEPLSLLQ